MIWEMEVIIHITSPPPRLTPSALLGMMQESSTHASCRVRQGGPLLVALGAVQRGDQIAYFNNYRELGSMSMTSYIFM